MPPTSAVVASGSEAACWTAADAGRRVEHPSGASGVLEAVNRDGLRGAIRVDRPGGVYTLGLVRAPLGRWRGATA